MMGARRRQKENGADGVVSKGASDVANAYGGRAKLEKKEQQKQELDDKLATDKTEKFKGMHLAPLPLLIVVMVCSGALWVLAFRDVMATGRPVYGQMDDAMLHFTKSTVFFDDSKGWKSKQGGLSAVESVTTDENNMGGLFVRKMAGATALTVHTQKLAPFVFQSDNAHWAAGHFNPMLLTAVLGNLAIATFFSFYAEDLKAAGAEKLGVVICSLLIVEAVVMLAYAASAWRSSPAATVTVKSLTAGKTSRSVVNRIVMKTVGIVTGLISAVAIRDLFFTGHIMSPVPRDDIYLEWTGAFIHSPPPGTVESEENGMEAPLYVGDKFVAQLMALHMLITCIQKLTSAFFIRIGKDGSGETKCKIFWKVQALGDALVTFLLRIFAGAAGSASLDLRWHLMLLGYETFILGLYAFY